MLQTQRRCSLHAQFALNLAGFVYLMMCSECEHAMRSVL